MSQQQQQRQHDAFGTWFKPHATGLVVLALLLVGHVIVGTAAVIASGGLRLLIDPRVLVFGYPSMAQLFWSGRDPGLQDLTIRWPWLIGGLMLTYALAMPLGR